MREATAKTGVRMSETEWGDVSGFEAAPYFLITSSLPFVTLI